MSVVFDTLRNPPEEFTPIPFWFINDSLSEDELKRQLRDFTDKGVNGVVVHPRIGMEEDLVYLGDDYFFYMKVIVEEAARLGMKVVLYDEGMYPSGSCHGEVVRQNPAFKARGIRLGTPGETRIVIEETMGTIRGIHFGEDDGEDGAPLAADILNPDAVDLFIELTHDRYYQELSPYFGTTIIGFFTDEPSATGRNTSQYRPYYDGLEEDLIKAGYSLEDLVPLFEEESKETSELKLTYQRLIRERFCEVYYKKLYDWCEKHGLSLMGHPETSDDVDEQVYFHIPGQDLIMRRVSPEHGSLTGIDSVQAKTASDVARLLGRRRNSNECFGVCSTNQHSWHLPADDMKWFIDWLAVRGTNLFIPHAFYYSIDGERRNERPPDVGPHSIWWPHYKRISNYMKRLSYLMTDSDNPAKIAVICETAHVPADRLKPLYENQIEFHYIPRMLLDSADLSTYTHYISDQEEAIPLPRLEDVKAYPQNDLQTLTPEPNLRVSHQIKDGVHLYFFVNEGSCEIKNTISLPVRGKAVFYDCWTDEVYQANIKEENSKSFVELDVSYRQSLVLIFDEIEADVKPKRRVLDLDFALEEELLEINKKHYLATWSGSIKGNEWIEVNGDEMLECFVNGRFVDVSFYSPHMIHIGPFLNEGENEIRLSFTGSTANRITPNAIPFGYQVPLES